VKAFYYKERCSLFRSVFHSMCAKSVYKNFLFSPGLRNRSFIVQKEESLSLFCHVTNVVANSKSDCHVTSGRANSATDSGCHVETDVASSSSLRWSSEADVFTKTKLVSIKQYNGFFSRGKSTGKLSLKLNH
jgi:hypothetical protein